MQTILGSGGAIGTLLAKNLTAYTQEIRLVSRNPQKVNTTDEILSADITNKEQVMNAVIGSQVVYLTVGLPYKTKIWETYWPRIMDNVIDACVKNKSKLVFFDNMYLYSQDHLSDMDENTPINPSSRKGMVRAKIVGKLWENVKKGNIESLVARAPDFLGSHNSVMFEMVYKNFLNGKKAMWLGADNKIRNVIDISDAAKATAILGNTEDAYNQVWHLPSTHEKLTGKQWIELFADKMRIDAKYILLKPFIVKWLGVFMPVMKEFYEILYQYNRDYYFNSSKFENRFNYSPISSDDIVSKIVNNK